MRFWAAAFTVLAFLVDSGWSSVHKSEDQCFVAGECSGSTHIGGDIVADQNKCLDLCKRNFNSIPTSLRFVKK